MGNGSKVQETGWPTPTGLLPCRFLPSHSHTQDTCGPLNLFRCYIRNGCTPPPSVASEEEHMSRTLPSNDLGERVFRALLLLYPQSFRQRFGDEMVAFFRARRTEARHASGVTSTIRLWRHLVFDITLTAPLERWRARNSSTEELEEGVHSDVPWSSPFYLEREDSMDALRQDLRFALRTLRARPAFTMI